MASLAPGWGERAQIVRGAPPDDGRPFAVWGHLWLAIDIIPPAIKARRPFWFIDNGYWKSAAGAATGYYRITYRGPSPVMLERPDMARAEGMGLDDIKPWRKRGKHILLALQGTDFGGPFGINAADWRNKIEDRVKRHTDRPVLSRTKASPRSLHQDFQDCWAVVSHSSNVAVEAAALGIPVFVERTSAAAPVGNLDLSKIESPDTPDNRREWWASLMSHQFSLDEMHNGTAYHHLRSIREQADARPSAQES